LHNISETILKFETIGMSGQIPVVWHSASGSIIIAENGSKYIDFTSGIFVTNIGHANVSILSGLEELINIDQPLLFSYNYHHRYRAQYLEKLISFSKPYFEKAHLMSSGTESTEAALKLILLHAAKISSSKRKILTVAGNYHGRTFGSALMSGDPFYTSLFPELSEIFIKLPFPDPSLVNEENGEDFFNLSISKIDLGNPKKFKQDLAGAMLETFQGWACYFYPVSYIQAFVRYVQDSGGLICFDEMQSGFGRTGKKFGFEHYNVYPDLICIGKGMGSGVPIAGVLASAKILDLPTPGTLSSTNSANPIACVAGLKTIEEIEKNKLIDRADFLGKYFHKKLADIKMNCKNISAIHGKGMIAAIHFEISENHEENINHVNQLVIEMMNRGLLVVRTGRSSIKLGPPLTISQLELDTGLEIISEVTRVI
jgi:4-aminobutyrate aminotransferase-like enzyme